MEQTKNFVILGMHRSATSLVSKAMADQGLTCRNDEDVPDAANPEGYWEDAVVMRLNDQILGRAGGSWVRPPSMHAILAQRGWAAPRISSIMQDRYAEDGWVMKDPRLVLTFWCWQPFFARRNAQYIFIYRRREEIIDSLYRRGCVGRHGEDTIERCTDEYMARLRLIAAQAYGGEF